MSSKLTREAIGNPSLMRGVLLKTNGPYDLDGTLHSGQAFRWRKLDDGTHEGIVYGRYFRLSQPRIGGIMVMDPANDDDLSIIAHYLAVDADQESIEKTLSMTGGHMQEAVRLSSGLRTLRQEPWETLISFIISANNGVENISRVVENLSDLYGDEICAKTTRRRAFPRPEQLVGAGHDGVWACKAGFRTRGICEAALKALAGELDFDAIASSSYPEAKSMLMKLHGIGEKVADCILLFSMDKPEAFPVDVWIERIIRLLYFDGERVNHRKIRQWAYERYGALAGYANQFLFNYGRKFAASELRSMDKASSRD